MPARDDQGSIRAELETFRGSAEPGRFFFVSRPGGNLAFAVGLAAPGLLLSSSAYRNTRSSSFIARDHDATPRMPSYPRSATLFRNGKYGKGRMERRGRGTEPLAKIAKDTKKKWNRKTEPRKDQHCNSDFLIPLLAREMRGFSGIRYPITPQSGRNRSV